MTYLQLCQRAARECRLVNATSLPAAVTGQTGNLLRMVEGVADCYTELQESKPWRWLDRDFTFNTVDGTDEYAYGSITDVDASAFISRPVAFWDIADPRNPAKAYLTSAGVAGQYFLRYLPWDLFQSFYQLGTEQEGPPIHISYDPQDNLVLGPTPDAVYTVKGKFRRSAQILSSGSDEPEMPSRFHMAIVWRYVHDYGSMQSAVDLISRANSKLSQIESNLRASQLPRWREAPPLA